MMILLRRLQLIMLLVMLSVTMFGQENYALETRYRNPVDTFAFHNMPTMLVFVHPKWEERHMCATLRMQKALESDSLGFRSKFGIKLFVIYPRYSQTDINTFDSFSPTGDAVVAFYTNLKHKGTFHEGESTPHVIFYDGKGHVRTKTGGTIEELFDSIYNKWRHTYKECSVCHGAGSVKPDNSSNDPDLAVGICRRCRGSGKTIRKGKLY